MIDGSSGNDSRAFICDDGSLATVALVRVLPRSAVVGDDGVVSGAMTVVASDA
jgi:hypothetical protein